MKTRLFHRWNALRATFWFVPALFALGTVPLALGLLAVDAELGAREIALRGLYEGRAEDARSVLVMIAGSMIGTAGVVFSITIVALSLTSSQYGPRLLRHFLRDPGNQVVLGTFVATFLYCLLVLRSVVSGRPAPALSVSMAVLLAVVSLAVLIYFFHHVAASIQAGAIVAGVARDLERAIDRFCARHGASDGEAARAEAGLEGAARVDASSSGYVQAVDHEALRAVACERDGCIEALHRAGDFLIAGGALACVAPADRFDEAARRRVQGAFLIGAQPTEEQDLEFAVRQLVEVALRALSPGINDPYTAVNCIDWLGVALARLAEDGMPPHVLRDEAGRVRLLTDAPTFAGVADACFQQIRQAAGPHVAVSIRLLDTFAALAPHLRAPAQVETIRSGADQALAAALAAGPIEPDRAALAARHDRARRALAEAAALAGA